MMVKRTNVTDLISVDGNSYTQRVELRIQHPNSQPLYLDRKETRRLRDCLTAQLKKLRKKKS